MNMMAEKFTNIKKYNQEFINIFGVRLSLYLSPFFGFDICKFDDWLEVPDGTSTKDFIEKKYGKKAQKLIQSFLNK